MKSISFRPFLRVIKAQAIPEDNEPNEVPIDDIPVSKDVPKASSGDLFSDDIVKELTEKTNDAKSKASRYVDDTIRYTRLAKYVIVEIKSRLEKMPLSPAKALKYRNDISVRLSRLIDLSFDDESGRYKVNIVDEKPVGEIFELEDKIKNIRKDKSKSVRSKLALIMTHFDSFRNRIKVLLDDVEAHFNIDVNRLPTFAKLEKFEREMIREYDFLVKDYEKSGYTGFSLNKHRKERLDQMDGDVDTDEKQVRNMFNNGQDSETQTEDRKPIIIDREKFKAKKPDWWISDPSKGGLDQEEEEKKEIREKRKSNQGFYEPEIPSIYTPEEIEKRKSRGITNINEVLTLEEMKQRQLDQQEKDKRSDYFKKKKKERENLNLGEEEVM